MAKGRRNYSSRQRRSYWIGYGIALGHCKDSDHKEHESQGRDIIRAYSHTPDFSLGKGFDRCIKDGNKYNRMKRIEMNYFKKGR